MATPILQPSDALGQIFNVELRIEKFRAVLAAQSSGMRSCMHQLHHGPEVDDVLESMDISNQTTLGGIREDLRSIRHQLSESLSLLGL